MHKSARIVCKYIFRRDERTKIFRPLIFEFLKYPVKLHIWCEERGILLVYLVNNMSGLLDFRKNGK